MFKIWFERNVPTDFDSLVAGIATGIAPGDMVAQNPLHMLDQAHAVIAGGVTYDAATLDAGPNLLVISRAGIGYEKVDIPAATARHIAVCNTPDAPTVSTAECAVSLIMSVARNIKTVEKALRVALETDGPKNFWAEYDAIELNQKQLGLVGLGRIGGHVAKAMRGLGMRVATYDPFVTDERCTQLGVERVASLEALLGMADVVSLHLPLVPETHKIMNAERFAQMKPGAIFVNVSRGGHVDEAALIEALNSGHLFGAGLDVTDPEPPEAGNPLLYMDNVVLTPHIASATRVGRQRIGDAALENVLMILRGEQPPDMLNPEIWPQVLARQQAAR